MRIKDLLSENFADGKNPENKGDSARHGIPKKATATELRAAARAKGRKGQLARWQMNMRGIKQTEDIVEGEVTELANTSLAVTEPRDMSNVNDRKQTTYKVFKFKAGKNTFLINFAVKSPPTSGKKSNWNAVNVAFGVKEKQDDYSYGDEIDTDLTAQNKNQFLIYSTVINTVRRFITDYNTEIDEIIMQGAGLRQQAIYQRFFQSASKYFPGWHHDGKQSLVRDVPRQPVKKVREQGVAESTQDEIHNYTKLDKILKQLCEMVEQGQHSNQDYGMVAAAVLDPKNRVVGRLNSPGQDDLRVHAERAAMEAYNKKYGEIPQGSIIITTCSPCNEDHTDMARARFGGSCTDYINEASISKVYCGYIDPSQHNDTRQFNLMETADQHIRQQCEQFASTFVDAQHLSEGICDLCEANGIFDDFEHSVTARGLTEDYYDTVTDEQIIEETAAWRRSAGKSKSGGLNAKGVASYRRENPGSKLQTAVTTKPSKLKKGSKASKRRKSFCARMGGVKGPMKKPNGKPTRKALALRKWNC